VNPRIIRTTDFVGEAVALIERCEKDALGMHHHFRLGLSGGNTPRPVYEALTDKPLRWEQWFLTFGDERCVPPNDKQSNYRMVRETLFDLAPIPPENVLRMRGEEEPAEAAADYQEVLRAHAGRDPVYRHDLLLLGMGDDGHTASLFPDTAALRETERWVVPNHVPKLDSTRITLTLPIINASRNVCFLVNSKGKGPILELVLTGQVDLPCTRVRPSAGTLTWLVGE
jgi:6-phosphogluconolactonase